ncbi:hypothetical protein [Brachybacterium paraconglomeratum]|uniref:hypothetical protein n=1 Tax=Brachybacterium paraconglomeratum TaxID=173362 RepID=UPI00026C68F9|nr:hypothetical protein [Brachybacterium paraconglomeratum]
MHTTEHTDLDGDALTVHRDKGLAWVTITRDGDELTVGPVPAHALTGQHCSSHTRDEKRNAESRPLTPDAITDEMVERLRAHLMEMHDVELDEGDAAEALTDALTEPPARPEGAEEIHRLMLEFWGSPEDSATGVDLANHLAERGVRVVGEDGAA